MRIDRLRAFYLRSLAAADLVLGPGLNILVGANAAGKTTVLEAAYLACRGQSFRARRVDEAIQDQQTAAKVLLTVQEAKASLASEWSAELVKGEVRLARQGAPCTRREQALALPVVLVDRQLHRLFEDAPIFRRRYLDWGLFYVEQNFYPQWRRYERALAQRNAALRSHGPPSEITVWDAELAQTGEALHQMRTAHIAELQTAARSCLADLLGSTAFTLELRGGWDSHSPLATVLAESLNRDRQLGYTVAGPHRAELRVRFAEHEARSFVSRGQQKLLACAMALAQAQLVLQVTGDAPLLLVDDLEAELSNAWQQRLVKALMQYPGQCLLTSLEWRDSLAAPGNNQDRPFTVFHVEHGTVSRRASTE